MPIDPRQPTRFEKNRNIDQQYSNRMATTTTLDDRGFTRITFTGPWPTLDELRSLREVLDDGDGHRLVFSDLRGVTEQFPHYSEIRLSVDRVRSSKTSAARRRAMVVNSDVQFGVARVFQSLLPGEVQVFRDEESAIAWLLAS